MKVKLVAILVCFCMCLSLVAVVALPLATPVEAQPIPLSYQIDGVPHYYQGQLPWCAPRSLEMVFAFHGPHIPASEIAAAANTTNPGGTFPWGLRQAAHFSDLNGGYTARGLGYSAFDLYATQSWLDGLKASIFPDSPIIVAIDSLGGAPDVRIGHAVVIVGFTDGGVLYHDPAEPNGAYLFMSDDEFETRWSTSNYWALFTRPWEVIAATTPPVRGQHFTFAATVTYSGASSLYPASSCQATITPPSSGRATLAPGEPATKQLGSGTMLPGETQPVSWQLRCNSQGADTIKVEAQGTIWGTTPLGGYQDRIGGFDIVQITQPCFIATAAYGTESAEEIDVLRAFRDEVLLHSSLGSQLVNFYYDVSPPVADFIAENDGLRTLVRELLVDPVAWVVDAIGTLWRN